MRCSQRKGGIIFYENSSTSAHKEFLTIFHHQRDRGVTNHYRNGTERAARKVPTFLGTLATDTTGQLDVLKKVVKNQMEKSLE